MLGGDFELSRDIILYELSKEGVIFIEHEVIESYSRAYKHLFDLRQFFDLFYKLNILAMIDLEVFTRGWCEAFSVCADAVAELFIAGGVSEVSRGAAYIVYISFKVGHFGNQLCFFQDAFYTS